MKDQRRVYLDQQATRWLLTLCILAATVGALLGGRRLVEAQPAPVLVVSKTGSSTATVGSAQTFAITITNPNTFVVSEVTVVDPVPANFTVSSTSGTGWTCTSTPTTTATTVTCRRSAADVLPPGQSYQAIVIIATAITAGTPVNSATANGIYSGRLPISGVGTFMTTITRLTPTPSPIATPPPTVTPGAATPTPTLIATAPPTRTATTTSTPVPTSTTTPLPTATPAAVVATPPPTTVTLTPTPTAPVLQFTGAYGRIVLLSGANPLRVGQPTRLRATYTIRNSGQEPLNFTGTCVFDVAEDFKTIATTETLGVSAIVPAGTGGTAREQVVWTDFVLPPGESATITLDLETTPPSASAGRALTAIESPRITARGTVTGRRIEQTEGPLLTSAPNDLLSGGIVQPAGSAALPGQPPASPAKPAAQAPAAPARPVVQAPAGSRPIAQAPAPVRPAAPSGGTVTALPRTGAGGGEPDSGPAALIATVGLGAVLVLAAIRQRRRRSDTT